MYEDVYSAFYFWKGRKMNFFSKRLNSNVVDALCQCGRLQSDHCSRVLNIDNAIVRETGHGNCEDCSQFRWSRWVTEEEVASLHAHDMVKC
jgi:hypothetical protein